MAHFFVASQWCLAPFELQILCSWTFVRAIYHKCECDNCYPTLVLHTCEYKGDEKQNLSLHSLDLFCKGLVGMLARPTAALLRGL
jgi:hypothetical protein